MGKYKSKVSYHTRKRSRLSRAKRWGGWTSRYRNAKHRYRN